MNSRLVFAILTLIAGIGMVISGIIIKNNELQKAGYGLIGLSAGWMGLEKPL